MIAKRWGLFVSVDENTSNFASFANGRVLISTCETSKIDSWVQLEINGVTYDVKNQGDIHFSPPLEIAATGINLGESWSNFKVEDNELQSAWLNQLRWLWVIR